MHELTLGQLNVLVEQCGLGPDTVIYVERDRDEPDPTDGSTVYVDNAISVRAEVGLDGPGSLILMIAHE